MKKATAKEPVYTCPICGFHYKSEEWAKKCEKFCRDHSACSLEIIQHAIENQQ